MGDGKKNLFSLFTHNASLITVFIAIEPSKLVPEIKSGNKTFGGFCFLEDL